eukprot:11184387-Lingulodinium_polyedra.AAC.1
MMRSIQCFAATTAREPHVRALHAQTSCWPTHGTRERAACARTPRARRRNGPRTARARAPNVQN